MSDKDKIVLERIDKEIEKISKKENKIYFYVIDTKGNPSGSLEYIYNLALLLKEDGWDCTMLYQEDDFVGVGDWLGEEYTNIPHENITKNVSVSPSDLLFIPELFYNIMAQTVNFPCKRVVIMQNYDYVIDQTPVSKQWGDFGIFDVISNTDYNANLITDVFPYLRVKTIKPFISNIFGETSEPKKMIVNIISKHGEDINKIIKPFYWKFPIYKWVSFRDLRGFPKQKFAELLRESAITIWVDEFSSFGYSALEAMKSGNIVIAKMPKRGLEWAESKDNVFNDSCVWFDDFNETPEIIASVVRSWINEKVPTKIFDDAKEVLSKYSREETKKEICEYVNSIFEKRVKEMEELKLNVKANSEKE